MITWNRLLLRLAKNWIQLSVALKHISKLVFWWMVFSRETTHTFLLMIEFSIIFFVRIDLFDRRSHVIWLVFVCHAFCLFFFFIHNYITIHFLKCDNIMHTNTLLKSQNSISLRSTCIFDLFYVQLLCLRFRINLILYFLLFAELL